MLIGLVSVSTLLLTGGAFAATRTSVAGVPISTYCSVYAKDVATKSVAINLIIKIKDDPTLKESLMRQYGTFVSLGKIYCQGEFAPEMYEIVVSKPPVITTTTSPTNSTSNIDISNNTPIINTQQGVFSGDEDYFTGYDETPLASLNSQQRETINQRITKAKNEFVEIVNELIQDGWLKAEDRNEMAGKISFKFSNNCNQLDGKILVRQWYNQFNEPIENELINLYVTINLCFTYSYEANYETFLDRIIYHELGHYYNYFHDLDNSEFAKICRLDGQNICANSDFVSPYAKSEPDEDYAETFAYYVYDKKPVEGNKLQQKIDYFKIRDPRYQ